MKYDVSPKWVGVRPARLRFAVVSALVIFTLAFAPMAFAGSWSWTGNFTPSSPHTSGCVWIYGDKGSACAGWNYWNVSAFNTNVCSNGHMHVGFQNNTMIRGKIILIDQCYNGVTWLVYPADVGMSGYLIAHSMYWDGPNSYGTAWATA